MRIRFLVVFAQWALACVSPASPTTSAGNCASERPPAANESKLSRAGEITRTRLNSGLPCLRAHVEPVPSLRLDAGRRVAHEIPLPELLKHSKENRREVRGF